MAKLLIRSVPKMERNIFNKPMQYKYSLDPSSRKSICPACNKKRFVRYINTETGEYLSDQFGRCDREINCGCHQKPGSNEVTNIQPIPPISPLKPDFISHKYFRSTLTNHKENNFVQFLKPIFDHEKIKHLVSTFFIGTSNHWPGATIFWQIDKHEKIHTGQVILYDKTTGKRIQKPYPHITWIQNILQKQGKLPSFNLHQCLFGEHQLIDSPQSKPIAIVESAKTAIIMTGFYPNHIWMATNGSANLNPTIMQPLFARNIILYPDLGQFDKWNAKAEELRKQGFKIIISDLLKKNATDQDRNEGLDIADYFIMNSMRKDSSPQNKNIALSKLEKDLLHFTTKNPAIQTLIDAFEFEIVEKLEDPEPYKPTPQIPYNTPSPVAIIDSKIDSQTTFKGKDLVLKNRIFNTSSSDHIEIVGFRDYGFCRNYESHKEQKGYCRECMLNCMHTIKINGILQVREYTQLEILLMQ